MGVWDTEENVYGPEPPFDATVKEPYFDYDPEYQDGENVLLYWPLTDISDPEWEEHTIRFSVGKEWDTEDNKTVENLQNKEKFNASSFYGRVINRVIGKESDFEQAFKGAFDALKERGDPTDARVWDGLRFRFDAETFEFDFKDDRGKQQFTRLMPVEYLGEEKKKGGKKKQSGGSGGSKKKKDDEATPDYDEIVDMLKLIASEAEDHDEFVEQANKRAKEYQKYDDLVEWVTDEDGCFEEHG